MHCISTRVNARCEIYKSVFPFPILGLTLVINKCYIFHWHWKLNWIFAVKRSWTMDMICKISISRHQRFWLPVTNAHWRKDRELLYEAANCLQIDNFKTGKFKLAHWEVSIHTGRRLCQLEEILFSEKSFFLSCCWESGQKEQFWWNICQIFLHISLYLGRTDLWGKFMWIADLWGLSGEWRIKQIELSPFEDFWGEEREIRALQEEEEDDEDNDGEEEE